MRRLERRLEADYRRFSAEKSLAFNLAYAEGFGAMTFSLARSSMNGSGDSASDPNWVQLMAWHLAEEIEHRTVTFDAYDHVHGKYPHRLAVGTWAQLQFLGYQLAMAAVVYRDQIEPRISTRRVKAQWVRRGWKSGSLQGTLRAMSPFYDPRKVEISDSVRDVCALFGIDLSEAPRPA